MTMANATQEFDQFLLDSAVAFLDNRSPLLADAISRYGGKWVSSSDSAAKYDTARELLFQILHLLIVEAESIFEEDPWKPHAATALQDIKARWQNAEPIIRTILADMGGKFYRDHMHHTIRVGLLALHLLSSNNDYVQPIQPAMLLLSCLYHDIDIPSDKLPKAAQILALATGNESHIAPMPHQMMSAGYDLSYVTGHDFVKANREGIESNHGVLAALSLINLVEQPNQLSIADSYPMSRSSPVCFHLRQAIRAVLLHDQRIVPGDMGHDLISLNDDPYAGLLVICDEAQDWDRLRQLDDSPDVTDLERPLIQNDCWRFSFSHSDIGSCPRITTAIGKMSNLRRLGISGNFPIVEYIFALSDPDLVMDLVDLYQQICFVVHRLEWRWPNGHGSIDRYDVNLIRNRLLHEKCVNGDRALIWTTAYRGDHFNEILLSDRELRKLTIRLSSPSAEFLADGQPVTIRRAEEISWLPECRRIFRKIMTQYGVQDGSVGWEGLRQGAIRLLNDCGINDSALSQIIAYVTCDVRNEWYELESR